MLSGIGAARPPPFVCAFIYEEERGEDEDARERGREAVSSKGVN